jgi:hypothetical protein
VIARAIRGQNLIQPVQDADQGRGGITGGADHDAMVLDLANLTLEAGQVFDGHQVGDLGVDLDPPHGIG